MSVHLWESPLSVYYFPHAVLSMNIHLDTDILFQFVFGFASPRIRSEPHLTFEEKERRALLLKEWSLYKQVTT